MAVTVAARRATHTCGLIACLVLSQFVVILLLTIPIYHGASAGGEDSQALKQDKIDTPEDVDKYGPDLLFDPNSREYREGLGQDIQTKRYQFTPTESEITAKSMEVRYNSVNDSYFRRLPNRVGMTQPPRIPGWQNCTWRYYNVEREVEDHHYMAYLGRVDTREENIWNGFLEYRFNLRPAGLKVKSLNLRVPFKNYRDGSIKVWVSSKSNYTAVLNSQELRPVPDAKGWDDFVIRIELSGIDDDPKYKNTFQNAQLFREELHEPIDGDWYDPFRVEIIME